MVTARWTLVFALMIPLAGLASCGGDEPAEPAPPGEEDGGPTTPDAAPPPLSDAGTDAAPEADAAPDAAPPVDPSSRSGTRLRLHTLKAGPGAVRTAELWDTELGVGCSFQTAADGLLRCLPKLDGAYYTGEGCTGQVVLLTDLGGACDRAFGKLSYDDAIYRKTATPAAISGNLLYYPNRSGSCTATFVPSETKAWVAEHIPSASFVAGTEHDEPRAGGLVARSVHGEDGSRILSSVRDGSRGVACVPEAESGRCVPQRRSSTTHFFSDNACTNPVGASSDGTQPDVFAQDMRMANGCPASTSYFAVGAEIPSGTPVYVQRSGEGCVPAVKPPAYRYFRMAPISASSFPEVKVALEGTGRVRARRYVDTAGEPLGQAHAFWDTDDDVECAAALLADGTHRCLPSTAGPHGGLFADAACSRPLGEFYCKTSPGPIATLSSRWSCGVPGASGYEQIYERGAEVTGGAYGGESCTYRELSSTTTRYFDLGRAVSPSELPEITLKVE